MLRTLLTDAGLTPEGCASLLGIDPKSFVRWVDGDGVVPGFILPELASVLGVDQKSIQNGTAAKAPAIWFKFRSDGQLRESDRELVLLIRRLGFYLKQLNGVTGFVDTKWRIHFAEVQQAVEQLRHASPAVQGARAALTMRANLNVGFSRLALGDRITGAGDVMRGILRNLGILLIEMPVPESQIDGCSFYVTESESQTGTPCLFVNTFRQKWFRRNYVIAHELAHAIFDIAGEVALIDFRADDSETTVKEARANAFARNFFASASVLGDLTARFGLKWNALSDRELALLVAHTQVDLSIVLTSALETGFIDEERFSFYSKKKLWKHLRDLTERALTPDEFFEKHPEVAVWKKELRTTTIPSRELLLPVSYIKSVIDATNDSLISDGKAAELLMLEDEDFLERFGQLVTDLAA